MKGDAYCVSCGEPIDEDESWCDDCVEDGDDMRITGEREAFDNVY
jgi:hypothetical protein